MLGTLVVSYFIVLRWNPGRVANPRPVATIKTGRVTQPVTDAFWRDRS